MAIPGEWIAKEEGSEDTGDIDTASIGDIGESSDMSSSDMSSSDMSSSDMPSSDMPSSDMSSSDMSSGISSPGISSPDYGIPLSPAHTRSYGKAKKTKDREPFYKGFGGRGVVCLPGDINGLTKKLHLLAAVFFAGNTKVGNELAHVLDALIRLKQLTRKEYTDITARLAASL